MFALRTALRPLASAARPALATGPRTAALVQNRLYHEKVRQSHLDDEFEREISELTRLTDAGEQVIDHYERPRNVSGLWSNAGLAGGVNGRR